MRRVRTAAQAWAPLVLDQAQFLGQDPQTWRGRLAVADVEAPGACVRCTDLPCGTASAANLCPVDAVNISTVDGSIEIGPECIGCGICVVRCPIGALTTTSPGRAEGHGLLVGATDSSPEEFLVWRDRLTLGRSVSGAARAQFLDEAVARAAVLLGPQFYRLVASLFRAIGIPALVSNPGDTSNRVDLVLTHDSDPIPVEVKSRTEVEAINVKSVQQALENKLVTSRHLSLDTLSSTSSLVVGYDYPAARTGIYESLDEIEDAFGIRVGLVSLRRLYEIVLDVNLDGVPFDRATLASLKGPL